MNKELVLSDIKSIIEDIDKCTDELLLAYRAKDWSSAESVHHTMESIMVAAHQELSFLYDYIKEGGKDGVRKR